MYTYASINTDSMLLPYDCRSDSERETTHKAAWESLQPINLGPQELLSLSKHMFQLKNGSKKASALFYRNSAVSVGHVVEGESLGTSFTFRGRGFKLASQGLQHASNQRDIAIFSSQQTSESALNELGPLAEDSYLLLFDEYGEIKFMPILVDITAKSFSERTAPGFSGALVVCHSFLGFNIAGIHVGEGRILDRDQINAYCSLPTTLPHDMHLPGWFEQQVKPGPPPENFRTNKRPNENDLRFPKLHPLEELEHFSDHTLYGSSNKQEDSFSKSSLAQGRHFATSFADALEIAKDQLQKDAIPLSVVKWPSVDKKRLANFIKSYRDDVNYGKNPKMLTTTLAKIGIAALWVFTKSKGKMLIRKITKKEQPVSIRFDWGLSNSDKKTRLLVLSHFATDLAPDSA